jgi:aryl-alcohol dehydrogenase-like predicted oxidoreductase
VTLVKECVVQTTTPNAASSGTFDLGGDLPVHRLGFGAMRITGKGIWGPPADRREAVAVLRRSVDLGINLVDTAESYGPHVSEELIAEALYPYPAGLVIATKGGLDRPGPDRWEPNGHPARLAEELDGSLRRLRVDCIDLYQLHRIDPDVPPAEQFRFLARAKEQGKVRHVGLSEASVEQIQHARAFVPVVSVQNRYNLADREWEDVLAYCEREKIAFIPWYPLQVGKVGDAGGAVTEIAARHGATPSQIALAWLLRRAGVMLPIPGTSRVRHLEENVAAAAIQLTDAEFDALA